MSGNEGESHHQLYARPAESLVAAGFGRTADLGAARALALPLPGE